MNSYFSVDDANKILPTVIKKFSYAKKNESRSYENTIQRIKKLVNYPD